MDQTSVKVRVFTTTGCSHCAALIQLLVDRLKQGSLAELVLINLSEQPEAGDGLNIRGVPWFEINQLQFEGGMDAQELDNWIGLAGRADRMGHYFRYLLGKGRKTSLIQHLEQSPEHLPDLITILGDQQATMDLRLGVAASFEELAQHPSASWAIPALAELAESHTGTVRADALHLLSLTDSEQARSILADYRNDADPEVREIVAESLDEGG